MSDLRNPVHAQIFFLVICLIVPLFHAEVALSGATLSPEIPTVSATSSYKLKFFLLASLTPGSEIILTFTNTNITVPSGNLNTCRFLHLTNAALNTDYSDCLCNSKVCSIKIINQANVGNLFTLQLGTFVNPPFLANQSVKMRVNYASPVDFSVFDINIINSVYLPAPLLSPMLSQESYTVQVPNIYTINFGIQVNIPVKGKIKLTLPAETGIYPPSTVVNVTLYDNPVVTTTFSEIINRLIIIDSLFPLSELKADVNKKINVKIGLIVNPLAVFASSSFMIEICTEQDQLISTLQNDMFAESKIAEDILVTKADVNYVNLNYVSAETTFNFQIKPTLIFQNGCYLEVAFPSTFSFNDVTFRCNFNFGLQAIDNTAGCIRNGNKVQTKAVFYPMTTNTINLLISGVINPPTTKETSSFIFRTANSNGNTICISSSSNKFKAVPNKMTILENFKRSVDTFDSQVDISAKIQLNTKIDQGSWLEILFPEDQSVLISGSVNCQGSVGTSDYSPVTCSVTSTQTPVKGSVILINEWCSKSNSFCSEKTLLGIKILQSFKNPSFIVVNPASISIKTQTPARDELYEKLSDYVFLSPDLKTFDIPDLTLSRIGPNSVGSLSTYEIAFTPPEYFRKNSGKLQIYFPRSAANVGALSLKCSYLRDSTNTEEKICSANMYVDSTPSINYIELKDTCITPCGVGVLKFKITNIRNPLSEKPLPPSDDNNFFGIKLLTSSDSLISFTKSSKVSSAAITSIEFSPAPVVILEPDITGKDSTFKIKFTPQIEIPISPSGSVVLTLPPEALINTGAQCSAFVVVSTSEQRNFDKCTVSLATRTVTFRHTLDSSVITGNQITLQVDKIKNPTSLKPTSPFPLSSLIDDNYLIQSSNLTFTVSNTAILNVSITRLSIDIAATTTLNLTLNLSNPIPLRGKVLISFPKDQYNFLSTSLIKRQAPNTADIKYDFVEETSDYYTVTFEETACPCLALTVLSYQISGGKNPLTTRKPTNSFKIFTQTVESFKIESINSNAFALPLVGAGKLNISSVSTSSDVTGTSTIINVSFNLTTPLEVNGMIMIDFPPNLFFKDTSPPFCQKLLPSTTVITCNLNSNIGSLGEYVESVKLTNYCINQLCSPGEKNTISISGLRNAPSTGDLKNSIVLNSLDYLQNIVNSGTFIQTPFIPKNPNVFYEVKITRVNAVVEQATSLDIALTPNNVFEQNSLILIRIPKTQIIEPVSNLAIICKKYDSGTLTTNLVECSLTKSTPEFIEINLKAFCSGSLSYCPKQTKIEFRIENLRNPSEIVPGSASSCVFELRTKVGDSLCESSSSGIKVLPDLAPALVKEISISFSTLESTASTTLTTKFTIGSKLQKLGYVNQSFSSPLVIRDQLFPQCFYFVSGYKKEGDCIINILDDGQGSIKEILYMNPCRLIDCQAGTTMIFEIQVRNRLTVSNHQGTAKIECFTSSNYLISNGSLLMTELSPLTPYSQRLEDFLVTRSNNNFGAQATYTFKLTLSSYLKTGAIIRYGLPKDQIIITATTSITCNRLKPLPLGSIDCKLSTADADYYYIDITQNFCAGYCAINFEFIFSISECQNPAKITSLVKRKYFSISASFNTELIFSSKLLEVVADPILSSPAITINSIKRSSSALATPIDLTFSFRTSSPLKTSEKIVIEFPDTVLTQPVTSNWKINQLTDDLISIKNDITSKSLFTQSTDKYGSNYIKFLTISSFCDSGCPGNSNFNFRIINVLNPIVISSSLSKALVYVSTVTSDDFLIDFGSYEAGKITTLLEPTIISPVTLNRSETVPALYSSLYFEFYSATKLPKDALIKISIPNEQIQSAIDFPALIRSDTRESLNYQLVNSTNKFSIIFKEYCPADSEGCLLKTHFNLTLVEMQNPTKSFQKIPDTSAWIEIFTSLGDIFNAQRADLFVVPDIVVGSLQDIRISRTSSKAGEEANYTFSFTLTASLPSNVTFTIEFPLNITYPPLDTSRYKCTLEASKFLTIPCNINLDQATGSIQSAMFFYACSSDFLKCVSGSRVNLRITLKNQKNTKIFEKNNFFTIKATSKIPPKTTDIQYAEGKYSASLLPVLDPGSITLASFTGTNNTVNAFPNTLTLSIRITNPIPPQSEKGRLNVLIPIQLLTQIPNSCNAELSTNIGRYFMSCSFISQNEMVITHGGISSNWDSPIVDIRINNLRNYKDDRASDTFKAISWGEFNGEFVKVDESSEDIRYSAFVPGFLLINSVSRTSTTKNKPVTLDISFKTTNPIPQDGRIKIEILRSLQLEFISSQAPTCVNKATSQSISCSRNDTYLIVSQVCQSAECPGGQSFDLRVVSGIMNPAFAVTPSAADSLGIWTQTLDGLYNIDGKNNSIFVKPDLSVGSLVLEKLNRENKIVGGETPISVSIRSSSYLGKQNSYLILSLPKEIFSPSKFENLKCVHTLGNTLPCWSSLYLSEDTPSSIEDNIKNIYIQNVCLLDECPPDTSIALTVTGITNINYVKSSLDSMKVSLAAKDYLGNFRDVDYFNENAGKYFLDTKPGSISSAELTSDNPLIGIESNWQLSFQTVTPLPSNAFVTLTFPPSNQETFERSYTKCSTVGLYTSPSCSKVKNTLTIYDVTHGRVTGTTFVRIVINSINNPLETTIPGFLLNTYTKEGYLVDTLVTSLSLQLYNDIRNNCSESCLTCHPLNPSVCFSCRNPSELPFLNKTSCLSSCPPNTFSIASSCFPCHSTCADCLGPSSNQCSSCKNGLKFSSGQCLSVCPLNSMSATTKCVNKNSDVCSSNCLECGPDPNYCYQCKSGWFWDPILVGCSNSNNCLAPYFLDEKTKNCQICSASCSHCSKTASNCEICSSFFGLSFLDIEKKSCVSACRSNQVTIFEGFSKKCVNCDPTCATCSGPAVNQCLSCNQTGNLTFFEYSTCVSGCRGDLEMNRLTNRCQMRCNNTRCYKCDTSLNETVNCTSCSDPFPYFNNGTCLSFEECPGGTFATKAQDGLFKCEPCSKPCRTCVTTSTSCTSCFTALNTPDEQDLIAEYLYTDKCLPNCPSKWSPDYTDDKTCKNFECTSPCNLCGGSSRYCYNCVTEFPYLFQAYCYTMCPAGTYMIPGGNKNCYSCDVNCLECTYSSTTCTKCIEDKGLFKNQCLGVCPQDYYLDKTKGICVEQVLKDYNAPAIFLIASIVVVLVYIFISKIKRVGEMSMISSFIVIGLPVELLSKIFIFGNFWDQRQSMGVGTQFMVIMGNSALGILLVFMYLPLFEKNFKGVQSFINQNNTFYSLVLIGICMLGPFYSEALVCGLLLFPKSGFFVTNSVFSETLYRIKRLSFYLLLTQIGLDIYILITFKIIRDIFHIAYLSLGFNVIVGCKFLVEAIRRGMSKGYKSLTV